MDAAQSLHPTDQTLNSFGLGKLDDRSAATINEHLILCSDCRKRVAEMSADSFLQRVRDAQKPSSTSSSGQKRAGGTQSDKASSDSAPLPTDAMVPELVNHPDYEIKRELGRGGMGVVYLARNTLMGRDEVLKVMGHHLMDRPGVLDRFLREIQAVARLRHPNVVTAHHATRLGKSIVFAMEYVEGLDLSKLVKAKGPMPIAHACLFIHQAALGLQHAHEEGLVHRDIKPHNLMLSRKGDKATVKILDFGLAKAAREEKVEGGLTSPGQALGTPDYIAPEQIIDAPTADIRADIYSLGGTLYYLLTGRPPFQAKSLYDLYQAHISRNADPLNLVRPNVPAELAALVAKMMAKDPAERFQTPGEVAQALRPFCTKANAAYHGQKAAVSQADISKASHSLAESASAAAQIETDADRWSVRTTKAAELSGAESRWESMVDSRDTERSQGEATDVAPTWRHVWVWSSVVAGVLMLGLFVAWLGGAYKVKIQEGVIVLENVPKDSEILIDGEKIFFAWPGVGKSFEVRKDPGQHKVEVKKDGFKTFGEVVNLKMDDSEEVTVRLEPLVVDRPGKNEADASEARAGEGPESNTDDTTSRSRIADTGASKAPDRVAQIPKAVISELNERNPPGTSVLLAQAPPVSQTVASAINSSVPEASPVNQALSSANVSPKTNPIPTKKSSSANDDAELRNKAILDKLEQPIAMKYRNETAFEDVLRDIKKATKGPNDSGISIYVDPDGLNSAKKTMSSPVTLDLEGNALKDTLPLVLEQLGMSYCVHDGLMIISVSKIIDKEFRKASLIAPDKSPKTAAIVKKLAEPLSIPLIENEMSLDDFLSYIKKATMGLNHSVIPIYVDPVGLNTAKKTMASPMTWMMSMDGVPLRTTLRLLLRQLRLVYYVKDGLLIITASDVLQDKSRRRR